MFTKAVYEGIKKELEMFNLDLRAWGCKEIGKLNGPERWPKLTGISHASGRVCNGTFISFSVLFPPHASSPDVTRYAEITLHMSADGRPPDGFVFDAVLDDETCFRGTIRHCGDLWSIDWEDVSSE